MNKAIAVACLCLLYISCARDIKTITRSHTPIPPNFQVRDIQVITAQNSFVSCSVYAQTFSQGKIVYFEIVPLQDVQIISVMFNNAVIPVTKRTWGKRGFFALAPDLKPGEYALVINTSTGEHLSIPLTVETTHFPISTIPMDLGKFSQRDYLESEEARESIRISTEKKQHAFATAYGDLIKGRAYHPRDSHEISSAFWAHRIIQLYDSSKNHVKAVKRRHRGIDLRGTVGAPVYAMMDGIVVLSDMLFYEGNMIIVNHGNTIFSYYIHLDTRNVKAGQKVRAGQLIGTVGNTGMSTGPHLHVSLVVDTIQVNPMSIIPLPVRD